MKNLKDTLSTILGVIIAIAGAVLALPTQGIVLPTWTNTAAVIALALATAVLGIITGRNADLSKKTDKQVNDQLISK